MKAKYLITFALSFIFFGCVNTDKNSNVSSSAKNDIQVNKSVSRLPAATVALKNIDPTQLQVAAFKVLEKNCKSCHAADGDSGGIGNIFDLRKQIDGRRIVPGDPDSSPFITEILQNRMPKDRPISNETVQVGNSKISELQVLRLWIRSLDNARDQVKSDSFFSDLDVLNLIEADLSQIQDANTRKNTKYFTFNHLANVNFLETINSKLPVEKRFQISDAKAVLSLTLNSLSWESVAVIPEQIDEKGLVFKVDIRDLGWHKIKDLSALKKSNEETFKETGKFPSLKDQREAKAKITKKLDIWDLIQNKNPYKFRFRNNPNIKQAVKPILDLSGEEDIPLVKADWFVVNGLGPDLYHDILEMPLDTDKGLVEDKLGISVEKNILSDNITRAGFNSSGVSQNNRMVEVHDLPGANGGFWWESYDFANSSGRLNLFLHPLGPERFVPAEMKPFAFRQAGGEIIFNLPNGLQAYILTEKDGELIPRGPVEIVNDAERPDKTITNGISCFRCHFIGVIDKRDEVASVWADDTGIVGQTVKKWFRVQDYQAKVSTGRENLKRAYANMGVGNLNKDLVTFAFKFFSEELTAELAASELDMKLPEFLGMIVKSKAPEIRPLRAVIKKDASGVTQFTGKIKRDYFFSVFEVLASERVKFLRNRENTKNP